jgi:hypothetical protein
MLKSQILCIAALAAGYPTEAEATVGSAPGAVARTTIRLTVSVAPRFTLLPGAGNHPRVSSNAPTLRYELIAAPADANGSPVTRPQDEPDVSARLMLIVPD